MFKRVVAVCVAQHNKIQFLGYEAANLVLVGNALLFGKEIDNNTALEVCAVFALIAGSICIFFYDPGRRSTLLFYGGVGLTLGGVFLAISGYYLTGISVALASLETTRGGILSIVDHCESSLLEQSSVSLFTRKTLRISTRLIGWYIKMIAKISRRFKTFGTFINTRPFLSGALIKAPLRLEFIVKKILTGDLVGAGAGLSWMILGDGGLALNDAKLKQRLAAYSES